MARVSASTAEVSGYDLALRGRRNSTRLYDQAARDCLKRQLPAPNKLWRKTRNAPMRIGSKAGRIRELPEFAPDFIPSLLDSRLTLYKRPEVNTLLADGLRAASG